MVVLTNRLQRGLQELARQNGANACFVKQFMSGVDFDRAIQRAIAFVGRMPKEDRYQDIRPHVSPSDFPTRNTLPET